MLIEHNFAFDGLTYRCARKSTPPPLGFVKGNRPYRYWYVTRSDGAVKRVWVPVGQEFSLAELEAAALQEFREVCESRGQAASAVFGGSEEAT